MLKILQNNEVEVSGEVSDGTYFIVYKDTVTPLTPPADMALIEAVDTIATLEALLKEAGEALKSGQVLVLKMFEVYGDPQYQAAFSLLADHQGAYTGKQWTKEQDDFSAKSAEVSKKIRALGGEA